MSSHPEKDAAERSEQPALSGLATSTCSPCFIVVAFRYGGNENVFPIGAFTTREDAEEAAREHRNYRGWKYEHRVYQFDELGKWDDDVGHATNNAPCIEAIAERIHGGAGQPNRPETPTPLDGASC